MFSSITILEYIRYCRPIESDPKRFLGCSREGHMKTPSGFILVYELPFADGVLRHSIFLILLSPLCIFVPCVPLKRYSHGWDMP